jgi:hypothetical protein
LWQTRLLFPGLIPLIMPMAIAVQEIRRLDTPKLRVSFIFSAAMGFVIFFILLDFGLLVLFRHPLNAALGMETYQQYLLRIQPGYAGALDLVDQTPSNAHIYFLCEPRTYGMERNIQPDSVNDNLSHDFYLYGNAQDVISSWRKKGYTHILLSRRGLEILRDSNPTLKPAEWIEENQLEQLLHLVAVSPGGEYVLFAIPPK